MGMSVIARELLIVFVVLVFVLVLTQAPEAAASTSVTVTEMVTVETMEAGMPALFPGAMEGAATADEITMDEVGRTVEVMTVG